MAKLFFLLAIAGPSICKSLDNTLEPVKQVITPDFKVKNTILPNYMEADFQLESNDGLEGALSELGVGWFARKIAKTLYPLQKIRQNKATGEISLDTESSLKSMHSQFFLEVPWEEFTLDMRTTSTMTSLEGNKLVKEQVPPASSGYHSTREVREFLDDDEDGVYEGMMFTLTIMDRQPEETIMRLYCKIKTGEQSQHRYGCEPVKDAAISP